MKKMPLKDRIDRIKGLQDDRDLREEVYSKKDIIVKTQIVD